MSEKTDLKAANDEVRGLLDRLAHLEKTQPRKVEKAVAAAVQQHCNTIVALAQLLEVAAQIIRGAFTPPATP